MQVIPVLSTFKGYLTNNADRAAYLFTYFIYNPGGVSDFFEDQIVSLRGLASKYQQEPGTMADICQHTLLNLFQRHFPELYITVDVTVKYIDGYKYGLKFDVRSAPTPESTFKPIVISHTIAIDEDYRITLNYVP